jgi:cysteine desulfurase/selenocysteine lyase
VPERPVELPASVAFGDFDGRVWLNTAHQGPLPRAAVAEAVGAAEMKASPHRIPDNAFEEVPERLRSLLARLLGAAPEEIVLGDSTSHGLHLIANGLDWRDGDEVLVVDGDYPATVLPWLRLRGVSVRRLRRAGGALTAAEVAGAIGPRTRLLAVTWVDSFTGYAADLAAIGAVCRSVGVLLVVNGAQAIGARPIDVSAVPVDALVGCGYKWLCGPYATGFCWLHPALRDRLRPLQAYWLVMHAGRGLDEMRSTELRDDVGVRAFDRFCPADFQDMLPWMASLELILSIGVERIAAHDGALTDRLVAGLPPGSLVSPRSGPERSTLVVVDMPDAARRHRALADAGVDLALREGRLRVSPHLFNSAADIDRTLALLG